MTAVRPTDRAAKALTAALDAGRWAPMARLPGELHLAKELGVARGTIRRALTQLATQGRLIRRDHAGFLVAPGSGGEAVLHGTVVLVTAGGGMELPFAEEYPGAGVIGAQRAATAAGVHLMLVATSRWDDPTQERIAAQRPTAVVMEDILSDDRSAVESTIARMARAGIPVVCHADPDHLADADCTAVDQAQGGHLLAEVCCRRRRSRPLILESPRSTLPWWQRRRDAIKATLQGGGITARCIPIDGEPRPSWRDAANFRRRTRILAGYLGEELAAGHRPDALFTASDSDVPVATAACRLLGLVPGTDVDVFGFDGYWSRLWELEFEGRPPCASIRANHLQIGQELLNLAMRTDRSTTPRRTSRVPVSLMAWADP